MDVWQEVEAGKHLGRLIDTAAVHGPQMVVRSAEPAAIVMSPAAYRALRRQADSRFADFLLASPLEPEDLDPDVGMSLADGP